MAKSHKQPNILVIMADDIGGWNISAYHRGMMGGRTPNIDRIASEGALLTDHYGQASCTAGRTVLPVVRRRETLDCPSRRCYPSAAPGDVPGVPAAPRAA